MVPIIIGLPRSSFTVCFSLFSVMVFRLTFLLPPEIFTLPLAPTDTLLRSEPGFMPEQKMLVQKKPSFLMVP